MSEAASIPSAELRLGFPTLSEADLARLQKATALSLESHGDHCRPSGETYAEHGLAVAHVISELGIDDVESLTAAVLHDALMAHTSLTEAVLTKATSPAVTTLIKGVWSLDDYARRASRNKTGAGAGIDAPGDQATLEAIRRALLSIIEGDIRIILIRMADCLQDLHTAGNLPAEQRQQLAYEAMHIYAPLANRLGIWHLKWQLEDLAFRHLEPAQFEDIARRLEERRLERSQSIEQAADRLRAQLKEMGIKASVSGRSKHVFSIYRKMKRKQLEFEQIYDIQALRVVLEPNDLGAYQKKSSKAKDDEDRSLCYQVLGAVHSLWQPIPREFDDYIATPKANGYKSLHTAVIDADSGQMLEVQIRTQRMHEEAERGIAAHWAYKEKGAKVSASVQKRIQNLRELLATLQEVEDSEEGITIDVDKLEDRIYVFTPNGDVIDLPAGCTPIDFAYQIHTEVGHRCRGARVNGKMVSLDYKLKSGEQVEIITAKRGGPVRDWMSPKLGYTGSARTRSKVRQWYRTQEREQNILQGREVVERELRRLALGDALSVEDIAHSLRFSDVSDFLAKLGFGDIQTAQITGAIALLQQSLQPQHQAEELLPLIKPVASRPKGLTVRGVSGLHTRMAGCCNPIAPEPIVGYITRGEGVTIHRKDCPQVQAITEPERLIEVDWGTSAETHPVPIVLEAYRRGGLIEDLVAMLRGQQINVPKTKLVTHDGIMTVYLVAEVGDLEQLNHLLTKLENVPNVIHARRERWS